MDKDRYKSSFKLNVPKFLKRRARSNTSQQNDNLLQLVEREVVDADITIDTDVSGSCASSRISDSDQQNDNLLQLAEREVVNADISTDTDVRGNCDSSRISDSSSSQQTDNLFQLAEGEVVDADVSADTDVRGNCDSPRISDTSCNKLSNSSSSVPTPKISSGRRLIFILVVTFGLFAISCALYTLLILDPFPSGVTKLNDNISGSHEDDLSVDDYLPLQDDHVEEDPIVFDSFLFLIAELEIASSLFTAETSLSTFKEETKKRAKSVDVIADALKSTCVVTKQDIESYLQSQPSVDEPVLSKDLVEKFYETKVDCGVKKGTAEEKTGKNVFKSNYKSGKIMSDSSSLSAVNTNLSTAHGLPSTRLPIVIAIARILPEANSSSLSAQTKEIRSGKNIEEKKSIGNKIRGGDSMHNGKGPQHLDDFDDYSSTQILKKLGYFDYAVWPRGGRVVSPGCHCYQKYHYYSSCNSHSPMPTLTSPSFVFNSGNLQRLYLDREVSDEGVLISHSIRLSHYQHGYHHVHSINNLRSCYTFAGTAGSVSVVMHSKVAVKAVQIYHCFNASHNVEDKKSSVLRHFRLIGWSDDPSASASSSSRDWTDLGSFEYRLPESQKEALQTFFILDAHAPFRAITLNVLSNHGSLVHTSICRLKIFGALAPF